MPKGTHLRSFFSILLPCLLGYVRQCAYGESFNRRGADFRCSVGAAMQIDTQGTCKRGNGTSAGDHISLLARFLGKGKHGVSACSVSLTNGKMQAYLKRSNKVRRGMTISFDMRRLISRTSPVLRLICDEGDFACAHFSELVRSHEKYGASKQRRQ